MTAALSPAEIEDEVRPRLSPQARRHDLRAGVRRGVSRCSGRHAAFAPVVDARARVLRPRQPARARPRSRARQYYAHPRNAFWRLIGAVDRGGSRRPALPRRGSRRLPRRGIGLWDVIASAARPGQRSTPRSASPRPADLARARRAPAGPPRHRLQRRDSGAASAAASSPTPAGPALIDLPSSSPAYAGMPFAEKLDALVGAPSRYLA